MKFSSIFCATLAMALLPAPAWADDPNDPEMQSEAALARDRELTRRLNQGELARVRKRDSRMFAAYDGERAARDRDHGRAMADYADRRSRYEQDLAEWRRAVSACRAGYYSACDR
ncbi:MAG: hypothetical protein R3E04_07555 [Sphingobium sp.]